jgi:Mrp family chromosome partitioning ATPase
LIIGKYTDGLILVVRSFSTPKAISTQFTNRLSEAGIRLLGVALNTVDVPHSMGRYGGYYYGKRYAKYYREDSAV